MIKKTGKGRGIDITLEGSLRDPVRHARTPKPDIAEGCPVREFKLYKVPKAMQDQVERCKELMAWPSRFC